MSHPADAFTSIVHPEVRAFLASVDSYDDPLLARMEAYAATRSFPLIGRESGRVLELLTRMIGGRRVFELGSGFGYSAYFFARAVGEAGVVVGSEKDEHELVAHRELYRGHALAGRIDLRLGSCFDVLASTEGLFDAALIDVAKRDYPAALAAIVPRIRKGGIVLVDNTLWGGKVARPAADDDTRVLQGFDRALLRDPALFSAILPVGDGLSVSVKL